MNLPKLAVTRPVTTLMILISVLVVGSSLMVFSSYRFLKRARDRALPMAAVNRGRTRADEWFDFKVDDDCAAVLSRLLATSHHGDRAGGTLEEYNGV